MSIGILDGLSEFSTFLGPLKGIMGGYPCLFDHCLIIITKGRKASSTFRS
jgi:hypothetical protein